MTFNRKRKKGYRKKYARPSSETAHIQYSQYSNRGCSQRPWQSRNHRGRQNLYLNDVYHGVNVNYKYYNGGGNRFNRGRSRRPSNNNYRNVHGNRCWRSDHGQLENYQQISEDYNPEEFQPIDVQSLSPTDTCAEFPEEYVDSPKDDQSDEFGLTIPSSDGIKVEEFEIQGISKNFKQEEDCNNAAEENEQCTSSESQTKTAESENVKDIEEATTLDDNNKQSNGLSSIESMLIAEPDKSYLHTINCEKENAERSIEVKHVLIEEEVLVETKSANGTITQLDQGSGELECKSLQNDQTDDDVSIYDLNIDEDQDLDNKNIDLLYCQEDIERIMIDEEHECKSEYTYRSDLCEPLIIDEDHDFSKSETSSSGLLRVKSDEQLLEPCNRILRSNYELVKYDVNEIDLELNKNNIENSVKRKWLYLDTLPLTFNEYVILLQEECGKLKNVYSELDTTLKNLMMNYLPFAGFVQLRKSFNGYPIIFTIITKMFKEYIKEQKLRTLSDFSLLKQVEKVHNMSREKSKSLQNLSKRPAPTVIDFEEGNFQNDNYKLVEIDLQVNSTKRLRRNSTGSFSKKSNYSEDATYIYFREYIERAKRKEKCMHLSRVDEIYNNILDPRIRKSMYPERSRKARVDDGSRTENTMKKKLLELFGGDANFEDDPAEENKECNNNNKLKKGGKEKRSEEISSTMEDVPPRKFKKRKNEERSADNNMSEFNNRIEKVHRFREKPGWATEEDNVKKLKKKNKENEDEKVLRNNQQLPKKITKRKNSEETDCAIIKKRNKYSKQVNKHRHSSKSHKSKCRGHSCDNRKSGDEKSRGGVKRKISSDDVSSSIVQKSNKYEENVNKSTVKSEVGQKKKLKDMPLLDVTYSNASIEELFPTQNTSDMLSLNIFDEGTQSETTYIDLVSPASSIIPELEVEKSKAPEEEQSVEQVTLEKMTEDESSVLEIQDVCDSADLQLDSRMKMNFVEPIDVENESTVFSIESTSCDSMESQTEKQSTKNHETNTMVESSLPASSIESVNSSAKTSSNSSIITFASLNYIPQNQPECVAKQNIAEGESMQQLGSTESSHNDQIMSRECLHTIRPFMSGGKICTTTTCSANMNCTKSQSVPTVVNEPEAIVGTVTTSSANLNVAETHSLVNVTARMFNNTIPQSTNLYNFAAAQRMHAVVNVPGGMVNTITTSSADLNNISEIQRMQVVANRGTVNTTSSTNLAELQRMLTSVNNPAIRFNNMVPMYPHITRAAAHTNSFSTLPVMSQLASCSNLRPSTKSAQKRKKSSKKVDMPMFIKLFLPHYCIFVNLVRSKTSFLKSGLDYELQAACIQKNFILLTIKELMNIIDSYHVEEFSINALVRELSKLGDLYFFLTVFVSNVPKAGTDFGKFIINQMIYATKLYETMDIVSYSTAKCLLTVMSYEQRVRLFEQIVKYCLLCTGKSKQTAQRSKRTDPTRTNPIVQQDRCFCFCGKIAIIVCKCKKVFYCSSDCQIKNLSDHISTCIG